MDKQQRLNDFLIDICNFIEKYYSSSINDISYKSEENWIKVIIVGENDSSFEVWSEGEEITIIFAESHWHIDNYSEPCNFSEIYENTLDSIFEILNGTLATYSCWVGDKSLGGGSFLKNEKFDANEVTTSYFKDAEVVHLKYWNKELEKISCNNT